MERQIILHRPWTCQWGRFGESLARAVEYFDRAITRDPTYALAYSGLSLAYLDFMTRLSLPSKPASTHSYGESRAAFSHSTCGIPVLIPCARTHASTRCSRRMGLPTVPIPATP